MANVYGANAQGLASQVTALLDNESAQVRAESGLGEDELRSLLADLERFRDGYLDVVHRERRLSAMEPIYDAWIATRDRAVATLAVVEQQIARDPEARRTTALGDWLRDEGLPEDNPQRVLARMGEIGEEEMERILQGYEDRGADSSETRRLRAFRPDEPNSA